MTQMYKTAYAPGFFWQSIGQCLKKGFWSNGSDVILAKFQSGRYQ